MFQQGEFDSCGISETVDLTYTASCEDLLNNFRVSAIDFLLFLARIPVNLFTSFALEHFKFQAF